MDKTERTFDTQRADLVKVFIIDVGVHPEQPPQDRSADGRVIPRERNTYTHPRSVPCTLIRQGKEDTPIFCGNSFSSSSWFWIQVIRFSTYSGAESAVGLRLQRRGNQHDVREGREEMGLLVVSVFP
jgi:hypothetical protein